MSDERLRDLERRWQETGSPDHELAYLRERVRVGHLLRFDTYLRVAELDSRLAESYLRHALHQGRLTPDRTGLAAFLEHEPARLIEQGAVSRSSREDEVRAWLGQMRTFGSDVTLRAIVAAAAGMLPPWEDALPNDTRPQQVVEAAHDWIERRTSSALERLRVLAGGWPECTEIARGAGLGATVEVCFHLVNVVPAFAAAPAPDPETIRWACIESEVSVLDAFAAPEMWRSVCTLLLPYALSGATCE